MRRTLLVAVAVLAVSCSQTTNSASGTTSGVSTPQVTFTTAPPTPSPTQTAKVPAVKGKDLDAAKKAVRAAGLTVQVVYEYTDEIAAGQVIDQAPAPHVVADKGDVVRLSVARPLPRIPNVLGKTLDQARRMLKHAGFDVGKVSKQASSQTKDTVISQSPPAGTGAQPGRNVNLVIAKPEPPPTSNCTSGYSPCLVYHGGADYDCAGGSGDGPYYTDPGVVYQVTGSDPYGLDANNNGLGCE
jgi:hypothetical protein